MQFLTRHLRGKMENMEENRFKKKIKAQQMINNKFELSHATDL